MKDSDPDKIVIEGQSSLLKGSSLTVIPSGMNER